MRRLVPNLLTSLRLLAAPVLAAFIVQGRLRLAILVIIFAGITDWLDGFAARKLNARGQVGVLFDPLADKAMLVVLFCALTYAGLIPLWFFALAIGRDLVIVTGSLLLRAFRERQTFRPSMMGKVSTFFQIVFAGFALLVGAFPLTIIRWLELTALVLSTIFTIISGLGYIRLGIYLARTLPRKRLSSALPVDAPKREE